MKYTTWIRQWLRPRPADSATGWDQEYFSGHWEFLDQVDEMGRYWIVAGYIARCFGRPSVLDIGCGIGLLEEKLRLLPYSSYTGVDISIAALKQARTRMPASCKLICADFQCLALTESYDVVVFMEVFLPGMPVASTLEKYCGRLRERGRIIFSLFDGRDSRSTQPVWKELRENFRIEDVVRISHLPTEKSWTIGLLAPETARFSRK
jgi:2-polyprenyl-3-methyl-5-hydroxy-6-metoxy-1,4-benzoquinol methylase